MHIHIRKYIFIILLMMVSGSSIVIQASDMTTNIAAITRVATTRYEYEMVEFDDEEGMINADEKINPQELIKGWAAFLARASKYLFVVANKVYIWWYGSARRPVIRG